MNPTSTLDHLPSPPDRCDGLRAAEITFDRRDAVAAGALVACLMALFWRVVFTSAMFFYRDVLDYSYPHARFIHDSIRHGALPYWNPYLNFGQPVLANPNFLFFYPYTLFIALLPVDFAYTMHYVVHFALAAVGTYWLARRWGQSRAAAFFAGFVFAFSGPVLSLGNFYNQVAATAWIPWALLATDQALETNSPRPWIVLSLVFSVQYLAAEPMTLLATYGACVAYSLFQHKSENRVRPLGRVMYVFRRFALVGLMMLGLCAVQLLPSLDLLSHSHRGAVGLPFKETTYWSFHPLSLFDGLIPNFFGPPFTGTSLWSVTLNNGNLPYYVSVFVGFVPVYFALAGWALGNDRRRHFTGGLGLLFLLLSFGRYTPIFRLFYLVTPMLRLLRFPSKLIIPALFFAAILAGWGVDVFRAPDPDVGLKRRRILLPLLILLVCVSGIWGVSLLAPRLLTAPAKWVITETTRMYAEKPGEGPEQEEIEHAVGYLNAMLRLHMPGLAGFALGGILLFIGLEQRKAWTRRALPVAALIGCGQLLMVNYEANPTVPRSFYTYRPPVLDWMRDIEQGPYRFAYVIVGSVSPFGAKGEQRFLNFEGIPEARELSPMAQLAFRNRLILARGSMLTGIEGIANRDIEWSFPPFLQRFWKYALHEPVDPERVLRLLSLANVKYLVSPVSRSESSLRWVTRIANGSPLPSYLYEFIRPVPRVYLASSVLTSQDDLDMLSRLSSAYFDSSGHVIIAADPGTAPPVEGGDHPGVVEIVSRQANEVELRARLSRPAYLVYLDRYDPNWRATVNGREVPVWRANLLFRALYLEPGDHRVEFHYCQRGLALGASVSALTLCLMALAYWTKRARSRPFPAAVSRSSMVHVKGLP